ncbi:MAG: hypothetical protein HFF62_08635 [Oscillospiraceae bacterium]|nr:hypothetical protein [Oscillospiraceae bacterium]
MSVRIVGSLRRRRRFSPLHWSSSQRTATSCNQNDLRQAAENLADAESRIRDANMAEEYTKLVQLNILQQSAQAMLSHSN